LHAILNGRAYLRKAASLFRASEDILPLIKSDVSSDPLKAWRIKLSRPFRVHPQKTDEERP